MKRPTLAQMSELLNKPNIANNSPSPAFVSTDPIMPTPMVLDVELVKTYEHNPRRVPNSEYESIYESVKANGLDQVLTITKRPGDSDYIVYAGGNTRLEIVNKLWQETGDVKYKSANFLFRPWSTEQEVLLAHLRENDTRGDLTFIDRAFALQELRILLAQELAEDELSNQEFASILKKRGYPIHRGRLYLYWYAVELYEHIPQTLKGGAGRPLIEELHKINKVFVDAWEFLKLEPVEDGQHTFNSLIQRTDGAKIDTEQLWDQLKKELSVSSEESISTCGVLLARIAEEGTKDLAAWFYKEDAEEVEPELELEDLPIETSEAEPDFSDFVADTTEESISDDVDSFKLEPWSETKQAPIEKTGVEELAEEAPQKQSTAVDSYPLPFEAVTPKAQETQEQNTDAVNQFFEVEAELNKAEAIAVAQETISEAELDAETDFESFEDSIQEPEASDVSNSGNSNYSYAVAQLLQLPLPPMPTALDELRSQMARLAQQILSSAGLNDALVCSIPTGVGFFMLPITSVSAENLDGFNPNDRRWLHALHTWSELADFSQQFMLGSVAHRYIPEGFRTAYPAFTMAMENAETDTEVFTGYDTQDWAELNNGVPILSGWHGRESRCFRFFADTDLLTQQQLATYMQLIDTYRALHRAVEGDVWRDAP